MYDFYEKLISQDRISIPVNTHLSDIVSSQIIQKYFRKVVRIGDYYTLDGARRIIELSPYHPKKKARLINTLTLTNQCRGIYKVKSSLKDKELAGYKQSLKGLDLLRINPVTIPREWGYDRIPNLLNAYYDKCSQSQVEVRRLKARLENVEDYIFTSL
jgi:hypothetical protein